MRGQFTIRFATSEDADIIAQHRARMFNEMGEVPAEALELLRSRSRDRLSQYIANGTYVGWLASPATEPNRIAGGAGIQLREVLPHSLWRANQWVGIAEGRHAIVLNVFTEPAWRRQGVALLLLQRIIEWTRAERLDRLVLHASDAGRALYERLGFVATNEMRFAGD